LLLHKSGTDFLFPTGDSQDTDGNDQVREVLLLNILLLGFSRILKLKSISTNFLDLFQPCNFYLGSSKANILLFFVIWPPFTI